MRMLLALTYSKCSKLPWLHVCAVGISSLLSILHTDPRESLEKIIMSGTGMVGRVGEYVPQKEWKRKAESYSANSFPYHPNCLRLSCWNKYPYLLIVSQTHRAWIYSRISNTVSQSAFICPCSEGNPWGSCMCQSQGSRIMGHNTCNHYCHLLFIQPLIKIRSHVNIAMVPESLMCKIRRCFDFCWLYWS